MTNFPTELDNLTNPAPTDKLSSPKHSDQHINENDAIEALQNKVGIDGSEDADSLDKKVADLESTTSGLSSSKENVANKSLTLSTDQASDTKYPSVKSVYDWAVGLFATIANLALKANLASPTFTGTPTLPTGTTATTQSANNNSTKLATTAYVDALDAETTTLTNKRITARVYSTTTLTTLTPEKATYDIFTLTAQSGALTIANHSTTTPADGDQIRIRIYCPTTIGAITFGTNYVAKGGSNLPTTTILTKNTEYGFEWNSSLGKYNLLAVGVGA